MNRPQPVVNFRADWLESVVGQCQVFVGTATLSHEHRRVLELASAFVAAVPEPRHRAEDLALRGLLVEVALKWGVSLHHRVHDAPTTYNCSFVPAHLLDRFINATAGGAKHGFLEWARAFTSEFEQCHPESPAHRAEAFIRTNSSERTDVVAIADRLGISPAQLRRSFQQTFGVTLAEYVRRTRLLRALELMINQRVKVESVALHVGYQSKKNFYRIFKQSIGMTPRAFLGLPPDVAQNVFTMTRMGTAQLLRSGRTKELPLAWPES